MKNNEYWSNFARTGKIDDYLNYIACTREESFDEHMETVGRKEEGEFCAGINYSDGHGIIGHAGW